MPVSTYRFNDPRTLCAAAPQTDPSVADGYDPDLLLAEHLILDCNKPTFWALGALAAHGRL
jgi:hypothetical protein